jgi:hypothetical protein
MIPRELLFSKANWLRVVHSGWESLELGATKSSFLIELTPRRSVSSARISHCRYEESPYEEIVDSRALGMERKISRGEVEKRAMHYANPFAREFIEPSASR